MLAGWVVFDLYLVRVLHLSPLQLVLVGTAMEATIFLCEVPTGVVYGIASLTRERTGAAELHKLTREHWGIGNGLHGRRDVSLREDASRVRRGDS